MGNYLSKYFLFQNFCFLIPGCRLKKLINLLFGTWMAKRFDQDRTLQIRIKAWVKVDFLIISLT